ncbi:MAG: hypothetical protein ACR2ND_08930 [Solirubrobacteraceae bacterium]
MVQDARRSDWTVQVKFADERVVSDAGVMPVAALAQRLYPGPGAAAQLEGVEDPVVGAPVGRRGLLGLHHNYGLYRGL